VADPTPALPGFEPGARHRPKRIRTKQNKERQRERDRDRDRLRKRPPRTCPACGEQYRPTCGDQKACSRKCAFALHPRKPQSSLIYIRDCAHCGKLFVGRQKKSRICTNCPRYLPQSGKLVTRTCASCGDHFSAISLRNGGRKVCAGCRELADKVARRNGKRRRKARKRGAKTEPYTLAEIAKRDRYRCGLCHKRVAMTKPVPHPKAPTIDHIVPLSEGLDDTKANVQLAHFICNSLKGAGGSQQLRLVG
jgi:HNH endonuclease